MMFIVHIHQTYWPVLGGCEIAIQRISEELVRLGHEVHVVTSIYGSMGRPKEEVVNGIYMHRLRAWRLRYPDLTMPKEIPVDLLEKADIVHGWSQNSLFTYTVCVKAKEINKPVAMYFLGVDYLRHHYSIPIRVFGYLYQRLITRKTVKITDLALATNEYEKKLLKERYGLDAIVLPHGVDEKYLSLPDQSSRFRKKYGIEGRLIAYIGRIHPTKGLDLLIKAFSDLIRQEPDIVLVIAGKGDERYLRKCLDLAERIGIKRNVKYLGYIPEEDKIGLIDASEAVVLPSRHAGESYPILIDEVKARGKPLIVTNFGALPYRVKNSIEGVVVKAAPNDIKNGILYALKHKHELKPVEKPLTWREVSERLLDIYKEALSNA
ncbi:MAG: glycosyltransferase family 4 protein [Infirmifilum sp.]